VTSRTAAAGAGAELAIVKIGTSSVARANGELDESALDKLCRDIVTAREAGYPIVLVLSGAVAAGMPALGLTQRPADTGTLQAIAAVGQPRLFARVASMLEAHNFVAGQVLLTPNDFMQRSSYLHARETLHRLLELRVIPVVNENDTIADDEIRYGDNDRLAALVSHMLGARTLLLLTDTRGLFTADPGLDSEASLIEEIVEVDAALEAVAGGSRSLAGSGGMASKLAAGKIAAWSGVRAVIASAGVENVVLDALEGRAVGTVIQPRAQRLASRKLWIAFARGAAGRIVVDAGARAALVGAGRSLLPAGVRAVEGRFDVDDAVEVTGPDGLPFAKGLTRYAADTLGSILGRRTSDLPEGAPHEVIHRDDLVVLP
jgi:glutamate 5-kinase